MSFQCRSFNFKLSVKPDRRVEFLDVIQMDGECQTMARAGGSAICCGEDTTSTDIFYLNRISKIRGILGITAVTFCQVEGVL
jgi:hypothetical protein